MYQEGLALRQDRGRRQEKCGMAIHPQKASMTRKMFAPHLSARKPKLEFVTVNSETTCTIKYINNSTKNYLPAQKITKALTDYEPLADG